MTTIATCATPYHLPQGTYRLEIGESDEADNLSADATVVGTLFAGGTYEKVATLEGSDRDVYRVDLPAVSDLSVTVTPDAELTARGHLDATVRVLDSGGAGIAFSNEVQRLSYGGSTDAGHDVHLSFGTTGPTTTVPLPYNVAANDPRPD